MSNPLKFFVILLLALIALSPKFIEAREISESLLIKRKIEGVTNDPSDFLKKTVQLENPIQNIEEMDKQEFLQSRNTRSAWNYFSFPTYVGGAAFRTEYLEFEEWSERFELYNQEQPQTLISQARLSEMSPIEKYEYLISGSNFPLTKAEWKIGEDMVSSTGRVSAWAGACHGTAPASINNKSPKNPILISSADGKRQVEFTTKDLKILLAFVWARNPSPFVMLGQRCRYPIYSEYFKQVSSCFDTNPGAFHIALTNTYNRTNETLIVDTSSGVEVWNRPILSYDYQYYNINSSRNTTNIKNAIISIDKIRDPELRRNRSSKTKYVLGIWMNLHLLSDLALKEDDSEELNIKKYEVLYDLELDENYNIIGGEWHSPYHPDFIWSTTRGKFPVTIFDRLYARSYNTTATNFKIPVELNKAAQKAQEKGEVSYYLLDFLNQLSQKEID